MEVGVGGRVEKSILSYLEPTDQRRQRPYQRHSNHHASEPGDETQRQHKKEQQQHVSFDWFNASTLIGVARHLRIRVGRKTMPRTQKKVRVEVASVDSLYSHEPLPDGDEGPELEAFPEELPEGRVVAEEAPEPASEPAFIPVWIFVADGAGVVLPVVAIPVQITQTHTHTHTRTHAGRVGSVRFTRCIFPSFGRFYQNFLGLRGSVSRVDGQGG